MELGFLEEPEDGRSDIFPSKIGGKPVWLDRQSLPTDESLTCQQCGKPLVFLLQIYTPEEDDLAEKEKPRTLFLFMCGDPKCYSPGCASSFIVLRCELNTLTESHPRSDSARTDCSTHDEVNRSLVKMNIDKEPSETVELKACDTSPLGLHSKETRPKRLPSLCIVCGVRGSKCCGSCRSVHYCSKFHQMHDWKSGHKRVCSGLARGNLSLDDVDYDPSKGVVLPELDIVTEPEPEVSRKRTEKQSEEQRMKDYERYVKKMEKEGKGQGDVDLDEEMLKMATVEEKDKQFRSFRKRIATEPQQVLRYQRGGEALYVSDDRIPSESDIPKCECGADRKFELQVMPQLLYYLKMDTGIDWGTLLVYTCSSNNCTLGPGYHRDFIWKQEI